MPETIVRRTDATYRAVHTTDEDWRDVVRTWLRDFEVPEENHEDVIAQMEADTKSQPHAPWLIASNEGLGGITPQDFAKNFEDVAATDTLTEIYAERLRQITNGYDAAHDDAHGLSHLVEIAKSYLEVEEDGLSHEEARQCVLKAAATLNAALDLLSRAEAARIALEAGEPS